MANLEELTMTRLKALAKEHNIKNISKLKKDEIDSSSKSSYRRRR